MFNQKLEIMPRICFEHPEITQWYQEKDEGTSTFDVCNDCACFSRAQDIGLTNKGYNGDPIPADAEIVQTGDDHPDIEESTCHCKSCGVLLTDENYY